MCVKSCCHSGRTTTERLQETRTFIHILSPMILFQDLHLTVNKLALADGCICFSARKGEKKVERKRRGVFKIINPIDYYNPTAILPIPIRN